MKREWWSWEKIYLTFQGKTLLQKVKERKTETDKEWTGGVGRCWDDQYRYREELAKSKHCKKRPPCLLYKDQFLAAKWGGGGGGVHSRFCHKAKIKWYEDTGL